MGNDTGRNLNAKVVQLQHDSKWATPRARSEKVVQIQSSFFEIQIYDEDNQ